MNMEIENMCKYNSFNSFFREGDTAKIYVNIAAYIIWAFAGLYLLVLMCLCMNIRISIAVLKLQPHFCQRT